MSIGRDGVTGLILLAISLFLLFKSFQLPSLPIVPVGPGFYPAIVLSFMAGASALLVLQDLIKHRQAVAAAPADAPPRNYRLVAIAFDPTGAPRTIGAADVTARHALKPYEDLTAVAWSEPLGRLLVIAESDDRLLVVSPAGTITGTWVLPGQRQEGLAFDRAGSLWIADDLGGLFKIPGALEAFTRAPGASS